MTTPDILVAFKSLVTFLAVCALVAHSGFSLAFHFRHRLHPRLAFALVSFAALALGFVLSRQVPIYPFGPDILFTALMAGAWSMDLLVLYATLSTLKNDTGPLEYALPRTWAREWDWLGGATFAMGLIMIPVLLILLTADSLIWGLFLPLGVMLTAKGYLGLRYGGVVEFRAGGIIRNMQLHPWQDVGAYYDWCVDEDGTPLLQLRISDRETKQVCAPDPALVSVLSRHGRVRAS